jgi:cell division septal protein FtsQ
LSRAPWPQGLERTEPLRGQVWTRPDAGQRKADVHWAWRGLAAVVAAGELALLVWLWFGPVFAIHAVQVVGARHLTTSEVTRYVQGGGSVLAVDGAAAQQRLEDQVWVRSATVQPQLPGTVVVHVSEWQPVAVYHAGSSKKLFWISSQAVILGSAASSGGLVDIQGPGGGDPHPGDRVLDPQLLTALVNIQKSLPMLVGQDVAGFIFDSCGNLTLLAKRGWKVYFGRVLTPEEFVTLRDKLSALKAIAGHGNVDYSSTDLEYVNVMNPSEPAVAYKSQEPAPASPSPGASPTPNPCK